MNARNGILYISCWSLFEPQCQRLNVDPLRRLARLGYTVHLITFERPPYRSANSAEETRRRAALFDEGIWWHPVRYHHRPLLLAKAWDGLHAWWTGWRILQRHPIGVMHARSEFPCVIAVLLSLVARRPILYESDAPIAEERADTGVWRRGGFVHRVTCAFERWLPSRVQEIVVLSRRYAERLRQDGVRAPITVIPSCADVERFVRNEEQRALLRTAHDWTNRLVIVYSGSLGGWYQFEAMADFFAQLHAVMPETHWLCLVNDDPEQARALAERHGVPPEALTVRSVPVDEVPRWLSAADVALAFIRAGSSKFASSPTKTAEYLACGLPILMTGGVGDTEDLAAQREVAHVLRGMRPDAYAEAIEWLRWLAPRWPDAVARCRETAVTQLSVQQTSVGRYHRIYQRLLGMAPTDLPAATEAPAAAPSEVASA